MIFVLHVKKILIDTCLMVDVYVIVVLKIIIKIL